MRPKIAALLAELSELREKLIPNSPDTSNIQEQKPTQMVDITTENG